MIRRRLRIGCRRGVVDGAGLTDAAIDQDRGSGQQQRDDQRGSERRLRSRGGRRIDRAEQAVGEFGALGCIFGFAQDAVVARGIERIEQTPRFARGAGGVAPRTQQRHEHEHERDREHRRGTNQEQGHYQSSSESVAATG